MKLLAQIRPAAARLWAWFQHEHDFRPSGYMMHTDAGEDYLLTVERCDCGAPSVQAERVGAHGQRRYSTAK